MRTQRSKEDFDKIMDFTKKFMERVDREICDLDWNLTRLGKESGVSVSMLSGMKLNKLPVTVSSMLKISEALEIQILIY